MKRLFLVTIGFVAFATANATAADLRVKAPANLAEARAYDWTGFYIGGHFGGDWVVEERTDSITGVFGNLKNSGPLGGGQAGYNVQVGAFVFGIQGAASWVDSTVDNRANPLGNFCNINVACQSKINWIATATGRIGVTQGPALLYFTGGAAWVNARHGFALTLTPFETLSVTDTSAGWVIGGGLEYALGSFGWGNWSAMAEYNYLNFGHEKQVYPSGIALVVTNPVDEKLTMHVVKAGINYRFGGPAVAKY
jgi:outer membrane immunogenic protein